ncbi:hypothetical protein H8S37_04760 [Mediterraneibacter sp. NSJ-55]|uniref:F5/8 type C domain-containing protein n=1 Tax=Mediterraneibacter hominis TaxID=2763054 RepID=A0A923LGD8_9FIRM|nr:hypothetical protein [Mediterraneibacter hominis]MBC5688240.1 hypothetical protein [Mediterraneibacter hominis]
MIANGTIQKDKLGFKVVETDENGKVSITEILDPSGGSLGVSYTEMQNKVKDLGEQVTEITPYTIVMENEYQNIPCVQGTAKDSFLIEIPFTGYAGSLQTATTVNVGVLPSGITLGSNTPATDTSSGKVVLNVADGADFGGIDILTGYIILTFTINSHVITKRFTWTKTNDGSSSDASFYTLDLSTQIVLKSDSSLTPPFITLNSYLKQGTSKTPYSGRFVIKESTDGSTYNTKYLSSSDEASKEYTISSIDVKSIECILFESGGITNELDVKTIAVITDSSYLESEITQITDTVTELSSTVDMHTKEISQKASQTDVTTAINNYDNTTVETIREQVAEHTTKIGEITSEVSDVKTTVNTKADGSTVTELQKQVSTLEQDAEGFKLEVSNTYATKDELNESSETLQSTIEQTAAGINQTVSDLSGNVSSIGQTVGEISQEVEDAKGNITDLQQTSEEISMIVGNKQDLIPANIRYIRDWLNGNTVDTVNRWTEIQVIVNDTNLASGETNIVLQKNVTVTSDITIDNLENYIDASTETYVESEETGWHYLQIDLGENNTFDAGYITVWHRFDDSRKYNHKLEISADGETWFVLFDSEKYDKYTETNEGRMYMISDGLVNKNLAFIKLDMQSVVLKVQENEENFASIETEIDSVITRVESTEDTVQEIQNEDIPGLRNDVKQQVAEIAATSDSIKNTVIELEGEVQRQAEEILTTNEWKVSLANIGAYDGKYATETVNMTLTSDGLTIVRSASKGYRTQLTGDTIAIEYDDGRGNYESVMGIQKDQMYLTRLKVKNGIDHYTLKELPISYTSGNKTIGCLAFISSTGNS